MIRNKYILCFMFLLFAATSFAQSRYALSFSDYMDGKFTALENLTIESRSKSKRFWNGGADFKPETGNKDSQTWETYPGSYKEQGVPPLLYADALQAP